MYREVTAVGGTYTLREQSEAYAGDFANQSNVLNLDNAIRWERNAENAETYLGPTRSCCS